MDEASQNKAEAIIHFGDFALNLQRRGLYRGEERVRLTAKPLETLIYLVHNCGRVVTKQEILEAVWKETFVTEDTLVHAIREIRRALGDDRDNPKYILTIPREGYRFVCEVFERDNSASTSVTVPTVSSATSAAATEPIVSSAINSELTVAEPAQKQRQLIPIVIGLLVILSILLVARESSLHQRLAQWLKPTETHAAKPFSVGSHTLITTKPHSEGKPALSNDGTLLLYVSTNPDDNETNPDGTVRTFGDLFVKNVATGEPVQITHQENPSGDIPVFTADNNFVVFSNFPRNRNEGSLPDLYKVGSGGGRFDKDNKPITDKGVYIREASGAGFSPDGQWVAYTKHLEGRKVLWLSPANDPEAAHKEVAPYGFTPRWSPDGKFLSYTTSNPQGGEGDIWIIDAVTLSNPRNVTNEPQQIYGITWTPDSRFLIFSSKRTGPPLLWRVPVEGGPAQPVTGPGGSFSTPSMSRVTSMLVFAYYQGTQDLYVSDTLDGQKKNLTTHEYHEFVRLSPSGQLVASVMQHPDSGDYLYVTDLSGNPARLTDRASRHPAWVNEKTLAYLRWDQARQQTEAIQLDLSDLKRPVPKLLKSLQGQASWMDVNPANQTQIAVVLTTGEKQRIVVLDLVSNQETVIASGLEYAYLRWSPDGSYLAWSGPVESGQESAGVWISKPIVESQPQRIRQEGFGPVWSANGSIVYFAKIAGQSGLFEYNLRTTKETKRREWNQTSFFDIVSSRLVYSELGSSGKSRVYSLTVE